MTAPHRRPTKTRLHVVGALALLTVLAGCGQFAANAPTSTLPPSNVASTTGAPGSQVVVTVPSLGPSGPASSSAQQPARPSSSPRPSTRPRPVVTVTRTVPPPTTSSIVTSDSSTTESTTTEATTQSSTTDSSTSNTTASSTQSSTTQRSTSRSSSSHAAVPAVGGALAGKIIAIDPGHNGDNANHPEIINQKINGGNGFENVCNTTGTETNDGYPEHAFNWHVAEYLKADLEAKGITVVMTRNNDAGVGPCTPRRAQIENESGAAAVISIHGDGVDAGVRGFYVLTNGEPTDGAAMAAASLKLARNIRDGLEQVGFPPSNTLGTDGLWTRNDLTGLNFSTKPKILVELGNMRNAREAATMSSSEGQRAYAKALTLGVVAYLQH